MDVGQVGKLIQEYGLGIALVIVFIGLYFLDRKSKNDTISEKDKRIEELTKTLVDLQERSIVSSNKLAEATDSQVEVSKAQMEVSKAQTKVAEGLVEQVQEVLLYIKPPKRSNYGTRRNNNKLNTQS